MICRICSGTDLFEFLDLGHQPPADAFLFKDQLNEAETTYPLRVLMCRDCGLAQLSYVVPPEILYQQNYPYEAGMTAAGRQHWSEFAEDVCERANVTPEVEKPLVVDIGSNVGALLMQFRERGCEVVGVDPAANIVEIAINRNKITTYSYFFCEEAADTILTHHGCADIITATNVFAHVDDLHKFMQAVDKLLATQGIFVIEAPYFGNLISQLEYDTIYFEHLSYLLLTPVVKLLEQHGMRVFDVQEREIHGGSFRIFVCRRDDSRPTSTAVDAMLQLEKTRDLTAEQPLRVFAMQVEQHKQQLVSVLDALKRTGARIVGVSAPAKGMTLLNYCGIGRETLDYLTEKSTLKIGKFAPGTHIPIVPDSRLLDDKPDYALLLAWNFAEEIMDNLGEYGDAGGRFIIPIPYTRIM